MSDASLRLGRLYLLTNRQRQAEVALGQAMAAAEAVGNVRVAYLTALMEARLAEFRERPADSASWYRRANAVHESGTAARIGLGVVLLSRGNAVDGWREIRRVFREPTRSPDPWVFYPSEYWKVEERLGALRAMVAVQPRTNPATPVLGISLPGADAAETAVPAGGTQPGWTFAAGIDAVRIDALVMDGARPVAGLDRAHFEVRDNGVLQSIQSTTVANSLSIGLVVDRSASTRKPDAWRAVLRGADSVVDALQPTDLVSIVSVSDRLELLSHRVRDRAQVRAALSPLAPDIRAKTVLWDGIVSAASLAVDGPGRPLVVAVSDGGDTASWCDRSCGMRVMRESGIAVEGIASGDMGHDGDMFYGPVSFDEVGRQTGGKALDARDPHLVQKLRERFDALRATYVLWYTPRGVDTGDGWHRIEVKLKGSSGRVIARPGYHSPRRDGGSSSGK
jgi:VWFA-related protein